MPPEFERILAEGEHIVLGLKPNRKRATWLALFSSLGILLFAAIFLTIGILGLAGVIAFKTEGGADDPSGPRWMTGIGVVLVAIWLLHIVSLFVRYRKSYYAVTERRLIISSGFIGTDFTCLNLEDVQSLSVQVDFLDKIIRPQTGTIVVSSSAAPMIQGKAKQGPFTFAHVEDPYGTYKRMEELTRKSK